MSPGPRPDGRAIVTAAAVGLGDQIVEVGAGGEVIGFAVEGVLGEAWGCPDRLWGTSLTVVSSDAPRADRIVAGPLRSGDAA